MKALILVDLQNDFIPGGALPVSGGDQIIPLANQLQKCFDLVVATQDWHPANHGSFAVNHPGRNLYELIELNGLPQVLWPVHCVQNTLGAAFVAGLDTSRISKIFPKGTDPTIDSYSGFFDNGHRKDTGLGTYLKANDVTDVYLLGLATDYCVKSTALDAARLGFKTHLIEDACRGVNINSGDVETAIKMMRVNGILIETSDQILKAD